MKRYLFEVGDTRTSDHALQRRDSKRQIRLVRIEFLERQIRLVRKELFERNKMIDLYMLFL